MKVEIRDCKIAGLSEHETRESQEYRFHCRELERCLPEISSSYYAERGLSLAAAIDLLESKPTRSTGRVTLSADEAETLRRALLEYKIVLDKYSRVGCHAQGILAIADEAGNMYREGKRSEAAMKINWTSGKRRKVLPHADIFSNYLLLIGLPEPLRKSKKEAVALLREHFHLQSDQAVINSLKSTFNTIKKTNPDISGILPSNWEKIIKGKIPPDIGP